LLAFIHSQRRMDDGGHPFSVVRIHYQRTVLQLAGGARKFAEHQDAALVHSRRAEFLRDQIHSILERSHQGDMRGTIEGDELGPWNRSVKEVNRDPAEIGVFPVDLADHCLNPQPKVRVLGNLLAAWNDDLDQRHFAAKFGILLEHSLESSKPFGNSFRVVETIDAQNNASVGKSFLDRSEIPRHFGPC
jgi:hypothetical protein